jgi:hypothetical protein
MLSKISVFHFLFPLRTLNSNLSCASQGRCYKMPVHLSEARDRCKHLSGQIFVDKLSFAPRKKRFLKIWISNGRIAPFVGCAVLRHGGSRMRFMCAVLRHGGSRMRFRRLVAIWQTMWKGRFWSKIVIRKVTFSRDGSFLQNFWHLFYVRQKVLDSCSAYEPVLNAANNS